MSNPSKPLVVSLANEMDFEIDEDNKMFDKALKSFKKLFNKNAGLSCFDVVEAMPPELEITYNALANVPDKLHFKFKTNVLNAREWLILQSVNNSRTEKVVATFESPIDSVEVVKQLWFSTTSEKIDRVCPECNQKLRTNAKNFIVVERRNSYALKHLRCAGIINDDIKSLMTRIKELSEFCQIMINSTAFKDDTLSNRKTFLEASRSALNLIVSEKELLEMLSVATCYPKKSFVDLKNQMIREIYNHGRSKVNNVLRVAFEKRYLNLGSYSPIKENKIELEKVQLNRYLSKKFFIMHAVKIFINIFSTEDEVEKINAFANTKFEKVSNNKYSYGKLLNAIQIVDEPDVQNHEMVWYYPSVYNANLGKRFTVYDICIKKRVGEKLTTSEKEKLIEEVKTKENAILNQQEDWEKMPKKGWRTLDWYVENEF